MKRAERQPYSELSLYAGIYCKIYVVPDRGTMLPQHSHEHDHVTLLMSGVMRVWCDDVLQADYQAPVAIKIPAGTMHRFLTLADRVTLACIHNADHLDDDEPMVRAEHQLELED